MTDQNNFDADSTQSSNDDDNLFSENNEQQQPDDGLADYNDDSQVVDGESDTQEKSDDMQEGLAEVELHPVDAPTNNNVTLKRPVYRKLSEKISKLDKGSPITVVPVTSSRQKDITKGWEEIRADADVKKYEDFGEALEQGISHSNLINNALENEDHAPFDGLQYEEGADLQQDVEDSEGKTARIAKANFARWNGGPLKGDRLNSILTAATGGGVTCEAPFWGTGVRVQMVPPTQDALAGLLQTMLLETKQAGMDSAGLIFSQRQYRMNEIVFNFISDHIRGINVQNWNTYDLGDIFKVTDLKPLIAFINAVMYPDGFPMNIPCLRDPATCGHQERVNLDISEIFWTDRRKLTPMQKDAMTKSTKMTIDGIKAYQESGGSVFTRKVSFDLTDGKLELSLKVPTVNEYFKSGREWINSVYDTIEQAITNASREVSKEARERMVLERMVRQRLCEYSHWIESGSIKHIQSKVSNTFSGEESIRNSLMSLSNSDEDTIKDILTAIEKFIEDASVTIIAIPTYECPKCHFDAATESNSSHPELTTLDPLQLFFALRDRKLGLVGTQATR